MSKTLHEFNIGEPDETRAVPLPFQKLVLDEYDNTGAKRFYGVDERGKHDISYDRILEAYGHTPLPRSKKLREAILSHDPLSLEFADEAREHNLPNEHLKQQPEKTSFGDRFSRIIDSEQVQATKVKTTTGLIALRGLLGGAYQNHKHVPAEVIDSAKSAWANQAKPALMKPFAQGTKSAEFKDPGNSKKLRGLALGAAGLAAVLVARRAYINHKKTEVLVPQAASVDLNDQEEKVDKKESKNKRRVALGAVTGMVVLAAAVYLAKEGIQLNSGGGDSAPALDLKDSLPVPSTSVNPAPPTSPEPYNIVPGYTLRLKPEAQQHLQEVTRVLSSGQNPWSESIDHARALGYSVDMQSQSDVMFIDAIKDHTLQASHITEPGSYNLAIGTELQMPSADQVAEFYDKYHHAK